MMEYMKKQYEEKSNEKYEIEKKYNSLKCEMEALENYCDKLIHFIKIRLPDTDIPAWSR